MINFRRIAWLFAIVWKPHTGAALRNAYVIARESRITETKWTKMENKEKNHKWTDAMKWFEWKWYKVMIKIEIFTIVWCVQLAHIDHCYRSFRYKSPVYIQWSLVRRFSYGLGIPHKRLNQWHFGRSWLGMQNMEPVR